MSGEVGSNGNQKSLPQQTSLLVPAGHRHYDAPFRVHVRHDDLRLRLVHRQVDLDMKYVPRHQEIEAEIGTTQEGGKLALIKWQDGSLTTMVPGLFDLLFMEKPSPVVPVKTEKCTKCGDWFTCSAWYAFYECWGCKTGQEKRT